MDFNGQCQGQIKISITPQQDVMSQLGPNDRSLVDVSHVITLLLFSYGSIYFQELSKKDNRILFCQFSFIKDMY